MDKEIENQMMEFMKPLFGDMAQKTIDNQKAKLELGEELSQGDYKKMAGNAIADKIYSGLMEIIETS